AASQQPFTEAVGLYVNGADRQRAAALLKRLAPGQATLERALALTWLQRSLGQDDEAIALKPQGDWRAAEGTSGDGYWLWQGQG
ncbi:hypothetical protein, partial [Klebsiella pneumoniae]|uniref:hypothetical protein n=1 Tax=Klebsiella pneumoniae TaxID=573 RepID=UPI003B981388